MYAYYSMMIRISRSAVYVSPGIFSCVMLVATINVYCCCAAFVWFLGVTFIPGRLREDVVSAYLSPLLLLIECLLFLVLDIWCGSSYPWCISWVTGSEHGFLNIFHLGSLPVSENCRCRKTIVFVELYQRKMDSVSGEMLRLV